MTLQELRTIAEGAVKYKKDPLYEKSWQLTRFNEEVEADEVIIKLVTALEACLEEERRSMPKIGIEKIVSEALK